MSIAPVAHRGSPGRMPPARAGRLARRRAGLARGTRGPSHQKPTTRQAQVRCTAWRGMPGRARKAAWRRGGWVEKYTKYCSNSVCLGGFRAVYWYCEIGGACVSARWRRAVQTGERAAWFVRSDGKRWSAQRRNRGLQIKEKTEIEKDGSPAQHIAGPGKVMAKTVSAERRC